MREWKRVFKVRGKASTPSKFHPKGKKSDIMGKETSKRNQQQQQQKEQGRLHRNGKERARSIFLCEVEEEGFKEAKESTKREKWREGNQHPLKQRKEERATGTMRVNQRNPPPSSVILISQRARKSEPRGSAVILDPALTFYPEKSL